MVFEGLAQHFERGFAELRELVGKEYAVVCERYFARLRVHSAAHERDFGDGVVRSTERTLRDERRAAPQFAGNLCICVVSRLSASDSGGRIDGRRFAIIDLPEPGGPTMMRL